MSFARDILRVFVYIRRATDLPRGMISVSKGTAPQQTFEKEKSNGDIQEAFFVQKRRSKEVICQASRSPEVLSQEGWSQEAGGP